MISATDLLDPVGPIQLGHFPADSVEALSTRLEGYIAVGMGMASGLTGVAQDQAVYWYGLYRAWDAIYSMMLARPAEIQSAGDSTTRYTDAQLAAVRAERDDAMAKYNALIAVGAATVVEAIPATQHTPNRYSY